MQTGEDDHDLVAGVRRLRHEADVVAGVQIAVPDGDRQRVVSFRIAPRWVSAGIQQQATDVRVAPGRRQQQQGPAPCIGRVRVTAGAQVELHRRLHAGPRREAHYR